MILVPIGIIVWMNKTDIINATQFVAFIFFHLLIYRTYLDGKKLADKNVIPEKDIWKMIILRKHFKCFKDLYLK